MKILTKEEEQAHYNATVKGGLAGGAIGMALGITGVAIANKRVSLIRNLTIPMKAFLVTSSTTFVSIVSADRASRSFEIGREPQRLYRDKSAEQLDQIRAQESSWQRFMDWGRENRYPIVGVSWVTSMAAAWAIVNKIPGLSKAQKLVQARVYAQGLTLAVLIVTAAFELGDKKKGKGRWETVMVLDPNDPEHKHLIEKKIHHEAYAGEDLWRDMVEAEERRMAEREAEVKEKVAKKN